MRHKISIVLVSLLLLGCTDKTLETITTALRDTAQAIGVLQSGVVAANAQTPKLLTDEQTRRLLELSIKINNAGWQASQATRGLSKVSETDRTRLLAILDPIVQAVQSALIDPALFGPGMDSLRQALLVIQTSLNAAKLALAVQ